MRAQLDSGCLERGASSGLQIAV